MSGSLTETIESIIKFSDDQDVSHLWNMIGNQSMKASGYNLIVGFPDVGDTLLYMQLISRESRPLNRRSVDIQFPPQAMKDMYKMFISGIAVINCNTNGDNGGQAFITSGGVGMDCVNIKLTGNICQGFSFCVIIVGKYLNDINCKLLQINQRLKELKN